MTPHTIHRIVALQVLIKNLFPRKVSSNNLPSIHFLQWRWMVTKYWIWKHVRSPSAAIPGHKHTSVIPWTFTKYPPAPMCWFQHQRGHQSPEPNTRKAGRKHQGTLQLLKGKQKPEKSQGWVYVMVFTGGGTLSTHTKELCFADASWLPSWTSCPQESPFPPGLPLEQHKRCHKSPFFWLLFPTKSRHPTS